MEECALTDVKVDVDEFITNHNYICYCEALIHPDGSVSYAVPSHELALVKCTGLSLSEVSDIIPLYADVGSWLVGYTGCVLLWYDYCKFGRLTLEQVCSFNKLLSSGCISKHIIKQYVSEFEYCNLRGLLDKGVIDKDEFIRRIDIVKTPKIVL